MGANEIKRTILQSLIKDTLDWARGGFEGKPAYGTNLLLSEIEKRDRIVDEFITSHKFTHVLCKGFELPLKFALNFNFSTVKDAKAFSPKCTLKTREDWEAEGKSLKEYYSFGRFLNITTNRNNTPFGVYFSTVNSIERQGRWAREKKDDDLKRNKGFLSTWKCDEEAWRSEWFLTMGNEENFDTDKDFSTYDYSKLATKHCTITTPGTVVSSRLNDALGMEGEALIGADEFDEILGLAINQMLINLFKDGKGASEIGKAYYKDGYVDPQTAIIKQMNIDAYSTAEYTFAIKILESQIKTIKNAKKFIDEVKACWIGKKDFAKSGDGGGVYERIKSTETERWYRVATTNDISNELMDINRMTIRIGTQIGEYVSPYTEEISVKGPLLKELSKLKEEKIKVAEIQNKIRLAKSTVEIMRIVSEHGLSELNTERMISDKDETDAFWDRVINGNLSFNREGNEIRKGGLVLDKKYCESYNLNVPDSTEVIIDEEGNTITKQYLVKITENHVRNNKDMKWSDWGLDLNDDTMNIVFDFNQSFCPTASGNLLGNEKQRFATHITKNNQSELICQREVLICMDNQWFTLDTYEKVEAKNVWWSYNTDADKHITAGDMDRGNIFSDNAGCMIGLEFSKLESEVRNIEDKLSVLNASKADYRKRQRKESADLIIFEKDFAAEQEKKEERDRIDIWHKDGYVQLVTKINELRSKILKKESEIEMANIELKEAQDKVKEKLKEA